MEKLAMPELVCKDDSASAINSPLSFSKNKQDLVQEEANILNLVLLEPEIPHNTGAIGRTCVATNTKLHLIEPLGFLLEDKWIKRTGLDYWHELKHQVHQDFSSFMSTVQNPERVFFATTKARHLYTDISFQPGDYIVLGKESRGIPEDILVKYPDQCIRLPMWGEVRSLNLSNAAAILIYEFYRQQDFYSLKKEGNLHHLSWENK